MYKFFKLYISIFYIAPIISIIYFQEVNLFPSLLLLLIISFFYLPIFLKFDNNKNIFSPRIQFYYIYLVIFLYFISRFQYIYNILHSVIDGSYFEVAQELATLRYQGYSDDNALMEKISTVAFICYATMIGINVRKIVKWHIIILLFIIFIESSSLARAGVLLGLSAMATEIIIQYRIYITKMSLYKWLYYSILPFIFIIFIFIFSAYFRLSDYDNKTDILYIKFSEYILAIYPALSNWLLNFDYNYSYGYNFLGGLYKIFGESIPQGHYDLVSTIFGDTNVFSIMRDLIQDFTVLGASIFFLLGGIAFKKADTSMSLFSYFFARSLAYPIIFFLVSPFSFATVLIGFYLPFLIILKNHLLFKNNHSLGDSI